MNIDVPMKIDYIGGHCPIEAEGTIGKKRFLFTARWFKWKFVVGVDVHKPDWQHIEEWPDINRTAGEITVTEAEALIRRAARLYVEDGL